jgi:chemotaxis protein histidine kinase CheA
MSEVSQNKQRSVNRMMVRLEHLDKLLSLAGEVIITSSSLHELQREMVEAVAQHKVISDNNLQTVKAADESSRRISQDLHDLVMAIRMVEVGETFRLFRRPVRDLSRNLQKEIDLQLEGEKVLIDKALAERIVEPLLHILRNAADHGIETAMERAQQGKPQKATILLKAIEHENHTELIVRDDGRGIDREKVVQKAIERGFHQLGDGKDLVDILCHSGFSTREEATDTSGRGVGLDIVRNMLQEFDGSLQIESHPGKGTTFRLIIPKLRAVNIIDALIVRGGKSLYALAIEKVVSLQGVDPGEICSTMEQDHFIKYLDETLPLFDLQQLLGGTPTDQEKENVVPVVILEGKQERIAVTVSEFLSPQKLVNVPLETSMFGQAAQGVAGTCIISGGRVGLTVDVDYLVELATGDVHNFQSQPDSYDLNSDSIVELSASEITSPRSTEDLSDAASGTPSEGDGESTTNRSAKATSHISENDAAALVDELGRGIIELQDVLITLENDSENLELMKDAFRRLHAAKGNFTMLGADDSASLAHGLETLLDYLRKERIEMSSDLMDLILDGVGELARGAKTLPKEILHSDGTICKRITQVIDAHTEETKIADESALIGQSFSLHPIVELQLLGALKQGQNTYETYLKFQSGRQADFLVAYLTLRKLCYFGTIVATLPSIEEIEKGNCSNAIKLLWATELDEQQVQETMDSLGTMFNIVEHKSIPTTVFRYEKESAEV